MVLLNNIKEMIALFKYILVNLALGALFMGGALLFQVVANSQFSFLCVIFWLPFLALGLVFFLPICAPICKGLIDIVRRLLNPR
jgi:branched-subunit amino acid ABC-type transport system permease component